METAVQYFLEALSDPNVAWVAGGTIATLFTGSAAVFGQVALHLREQRRDAHREQMDLLYRANMEFSEHNLPGPASREYAISSSANDAVDARNKLIPCLYGQVNVLYGVYKNRSCFSRSEIRRYRNWSRSTVVPWALAWPELDGVRANFINELWDDKFIMGWLVPDGWLTIIDRQPPHSAAPGGVPASPKDDDEGDYFGVAAE